MKDRYAQPSLARRNFINAGRRNPQTDARMLQKVNHCQSRAQVVVHVDHGAGR